MDVVGRADRDRINGRIRQNLLVIRDRLAAAVFVHRGLGPFREDIAEIHDFRFRVVHVGGDVRVVGNVAAANDSDFHGNSSFFCNMGESPGGFRLSSAQRLYSRGDKPISRWNARLNA